MMICHWWVVVNKDKYVVTVCTPACLAVEICKQLYTLLCGGSAKLIYTYLEEG